MNAEEERLSEILKINWKKWGPYLSERQWGTAREDYSVDGSAWEYVSYEDAIYKAYRWGEDGIAGISDEEQFLCFSVSFWNKRDPVLKERLFGLSSPEGLHGEDVKELYYYLDSTPTHSYMKYLYKYPQKAFPYKELREKNKGRLEIPEFEITDTGAFDDGYWNIIIEYAKESAEDILVKISITNVSKQTAQLDVLPTLWFRNTWSWSNKPRPLIHKPENDYKKLVYLEAFHPYMNSRMWFYAQKPDEVLFTENETNFTKTREGKSAVRLAKDSINEYITKKEDSVSFDSAKGGTKVATRYDLKIEPGKTKILRLKLSNTSKAIDPLGKDFKTVFKERTAEADIFYNSILKGRTAEELNIQRQALSGLLWNKQFYNYSINKWKSGDIINPPPHSGMENVRNYNWRRLDTKNVMSMPDKWEYPWFAAWDTAFHAVALALVDIDFAKNQLDILTREWFMHPNGQIPAYEWNFSDVNPPVHAWATYQVYTSEKKKKGKGDRVFLERVFQKLLLNFTWWVNRKDESGNNIFQGGFLGLDNIGVFDRSSSLPTGSHISQSDGTSWMGMYCLDMFSIAVELAKENRVYEDMAVKFFEHFLYIADAINGRDGGLWNEEDGFYYDVLNLHNGIRIPLKTRSIVGLIPLFAVRTLNPDNLENLPDLRNKIRWFIKHRPDLTQNVFSLRLEGENDRKLLSIVDQFKLKQVLKTMLDESEFLSAFGIRSMSKVHSKKPYYLEVEGKKYKINYQPGESSDRVFGGNSNWRGPVWLPINYLLIQSLKEFYNYFGNDFAVEYPSSSGLFLNLHDVSKELSKRLINIFKEGNNKNRPYQDGKEKAISDSDKPSSLLFHEYFHGDTGKGLGASHQTGWTALVANLIQSIRKT
jgi:hypothetical protein